MLPSRGALKAGLRAGSRKHELGVVPLRYLGPRQPSRHFGTRLALNGPQGSSQPRLHSHLGFRPLASIAGTTFPLQAQNSTIRPGGQPGQRRLASTTANVTTAPAEVAASSPSASLIDALDGNSLLNMPEQIGYLHAMGLDFGWGPTSMMQWLLEHVHVYSGLPWWGSILATAVLVRVVMFRPLLSASEHSAKFTELRKNPRFNELQAQLVVAFRERGNADQGYLLRKEMQTMQREAGVQMWRTMLPLIQLPLGIGMFRLLRGMAALPVPGLEHGGLLWFSNLAIPDPFFIVPVASAALMWVIMKQNIPFVPPESRTMMKMLSYVLTPLSLVVTIFLPADLQWFFLVSTILQAGQSWLFRQPWLRKWAGLGPLPKFLESPAPAPANALAAGGKWAPPGRGLRMTSRPAADDNLTVSGISSTVKDSWSTVRQKTKEYGDKSQRKSEAEKARVYEEKRALEERERFYARRQMKEERKKQARN